MTIKYAHKKFYRIQLYSTNVLNGGKWYNGSYFIDIQEMLGSDRFQIAVESFNLSKTNNNSAYVIHLKNLCQNDTYSTLTSSTSFNILAYNGPSFYRFIDFSSIGCPLKDLTFLRTNSLQIQFTDLSGVQCLNDHFGNASGDSLAWVMSLVVFEIPKSEEI